MSDATTPRYLTLRAAFGGLGLVYFGLIALLGLAVFLALTVGPVRLTFSQIWASMTGAGDQVTETILFDIRAPRMVLALVVGASLAIAGRACKGF